MEDINRLKIVLAEKKKTGKWLAETLGKDQTTVSNGAPIRHNQIFIH